jgi:flagellar assembly protein FliH
LEEARKRSLSKIVRDKTVGAFADSLKAAGSVRDVLLRTTSKTPTKRDQRRDVAREEGMQIGHQDGYLAGFEEGKRLAYADSKRELDHANAAQLERFASSVHTILDQLQSERQDFFKRAEEALSDLATEIARRAIARELELSRESVVAIAHQVLEECTQATRVRLRVSPMDGSIMEARRTELKAAFSHIDTLEIVEDRSIAFGCKLETDLGMIDARVEDYLARIVEEAKEGR